MNIIQKFLNSIFKRNILDKSKFIITEAIKPQDLDNLKIQSDLEKLKEFEISIRKSHSDTFRKDIQLSEYSDNLSIKNPFVGE